MSRPRLAARVAPFLVALAVLAIPGTLPSRAADGAAVALEHEESRELVAFVRSAGELVAPNPVGACMALKKEDSKWRAGGRYVFIIDMLGISRCHPVRPDLEGTDISELRDPDGKPIVEMFRAKLAGSRRDGWVHYLWPQPGTNTLRWKTTYLVRVTDPDGHDFIVGSGDYGLPLERAFIVDQVDDAVALLAKAGAAAFATLRDPASEFRFLDTYVFVFDTAGIQRVNAAFPNLEGSNLLDFTDTQGMVPGKAMLELVGKQESGWVDYLWPKPGDTKPSRKTSYVRRVTVDGQLLVVGSGLYVD